MLTQMPRSGPRPSSSAEPTTGPHRMPSDRAVELSRMALGRSAGPTKSSSSSCSGGAHSAPAMPCRIEQDARVPDGEGAGGEQDAPGERHRHEQRLRALDQLAAVVAVGECAEVRGKQQERQPVADDLEAGQRGGVELLPDHPVGDDVLDVVGHHRQGRAAQVHPAGRVAQRRELGRLRCRAPVLPARLGRDRSGSRTATCVGTPQAAHMLLLQPRAMGVRAASLRQGARGARPAITRNGRRPDAIPGRTGGRTCAACLGRVARCVAGCTRAPAPRTSRFVGWYGTREARNRAACRDRLTRVRTSAPGGRGPRRPRAAGAPPPPGRRAARRRPAASARPRSTRPASSRDPVALVQVLADEDQVDGDVPLRLAVLGPALVRADREQLAAVADRGRDRPGRAARRR